MANEPRFKVPILVVLVGFIVAFGGFDCDPARALAPEAADDEIASAADYPVPEFGVDVRFDRHNLLVRLKPDKPGGTKFDPLLPGAWGFSLFLSTDNSLDASDFAGAWDHYVCALPWGYTRQGAGVWGPITREQAWEGEPKARAKTLLDVPSRQVTLKVPLADIGSRGPVTYKVQVYRVELNPDGTLNARMVKFYTGKSEPVAIWAE